MKTQPVVIQPDVKMPAPPQFPEMPNWQPPPVVQMTPPIGNPLDEAAERAERTVGLWVIVTSVAVLAIAAGLAARFVVRARANGDFFDDPWIKSQMENGGAKPPE
jgi:hypothetical protein